MNPDDMTDEQVAEMIAKIRKILPVLARLSQRIAEDFSLWERELATQGWADR